MELYREEPWSKECRVFLGRGVGNAIAKPKQTKVPVEAGHRWLEERLAPTGKPVGLRNWGAE